MVVVLFLVRFLHLRFIVLLPMPARYVVKNIVAEELADCCEI